MKDTDTINLVCDVVVDLLVQQRKSSVPKKNCKIYLERDEWGNIQLVISGKQKFKLEKNILRVFDNFAAQGKMTIELISPQVLILISNAQTQQLQKFLPLIHKIQKEPDTTHLIELYGEEEEGEGEEEENE